MIDGEICGVAALKQLNFFKKKKKEKSKQNNIVLR